MRILITYLVYILSSIVSFHAQQKLALHLSDFNLYGNIKSFTENTVNYADANRVLANYNTFFGRNNPKFINEFYFDNLGNLIESKSEDPIYIWKKYEYSYKNGKAQLNKISALSKNNMADEYKPLYTVSLTHKKNYLDYKTKKSVGKAQIIRRIFDKDGRILRELVVGKKSEKEYQYSYDSHNNVTERKRNNGYITKTEYQYDETGKISQEKETDYNERKVIKNYKDGLLTSYEVQGDYTMNYSYEFDAHGNWLKRSTLINNILISEDFRQIQYK